MKSVSIIEPYAVAVTDVDPPPIKEGEALLKIKYCGVCGADVASYTGNQPFTTYPRVPGHEFSAEILEIPANDKGLKKGDLVTCNPYFNCGKCYSCVRGYVNCCTENQTMGVQRDGSFCEVIAMPIERIIPGKGLDAKQLALIEPFTISYHASKRANIKQGDKVLIVGAGPIGLFALISAKLRGAWVCVADLLDGRLEMAKGYGADGVINTRTQNLTQETGRVTGHHGFDVCIEACGSSETFLACIENAAFAANIILIGNGKKETTFLHSILLKKELNIFGSRNSYTEDFEEVIDIVQAGQVDLEKMVSAVYPMDQVHEAFEALVHNDGSLAKVLVAVNP
jgi:2-desacetyl-2-hydroxyethyl bacteriochlorophyllide A dehydrogenase